MILRYLFFFELGVKEDFFFKDELGQQEDLIQFVLIMKIY